MKSDPSFFEKRPVVFCKTIPLEGANRTPMFRPLWHLWQQKNEIAVGCSCVHTREALLEDVSQNTKIWGTFFVGKIRISERTTQSGCKRFLSRTFFVLLSWLGKNSSWYSRKCILSRFFHSLRLYLPIYNRGARNEKHLGHQKTSTINVSATFKGSGEWENR